MSEAWRQLWTAVRDLTIRPVKTVRRWRETAWLWRTYERDDADRGY